MANNIVYEAKNYTGYHDMRKDMEKQVYRLDETRTTHFTYEFQNFFHPFIGELLSMLNQKSLSGMLAPDFLDGLSGKKENPPVTDTFFSYFGYYYDKPATSKYVSVEGSPQEIDVSKSGAYACYNWELLFHIPLTIAVHLSKTQRFAESQHWFHYIFDPTCNDTDTDIPERFWKFIAFRHPESRRYIDEIVRLLSMPKNELSPAEQKAQEEELASYQAILNRPFQPHAVARTRPLAYQYSVVMKYLDNLIAWGDHLFQQDTLESINEATQRYVLAANILGPRPQRIPQSGTVKARTFAQLKQEGLGPIGNAMVELETRFPFNLAPVVSVNGSADFASALFSIGQSLYFCVPPNDKLLEYWDIVSDRLFKIRHCMNIQGVVRPLALFDPPLDPGMLIKAAAAGIDIGSIVSGLNQPAGPVRSRVLIQKALELCGEVRGLGNSLLSALEKGDAENLALTRQRHEIQIQQLAQEVRFLQWKSAEEATKSLLNSRATTLERFNYYRRLLDLPADPNVPETITLDRRQLTEENFDEAYAALVGQYDKALTLQKLPALKLVGGDSPAQQSGAAGQGQLYLNQNEDAELNSHLPTARDERLASSALDTVASVVTMLPSLNVDAHFWGLGISSEVFKGVTLAAVSKIGAEILRTLAAWEQDQAGIASRTASYERRADEWMNQYNLAAHELMQNGRQILTSLIAEQISHHEYLNVQKQIENAQEVDEFMHDKFTNEELYLWMQGEISRLYYEFYRFAFDTARKAERMMKQELMRPELDNQDFVKYNYWDGGRKGLLSGEALYLDVKRMEAAYLDNNKRELELTKHVSLRQLDPFQLLALKVQGSCQINIPEWLPDFGCPGHYMRRIKSVAISIPSVTGPYTSVNCTLSLLRSSVRKSPLLKENEYLRQGTEDDRFIDYAGAVQSIVTSTGNNDSGMFETSLNDERLLPFEGAGVDSTWKLELPDPQKYPAFDYETISDVVLHIRYTARQGVPVTNVEDTIDSLFKEVGQSRLALLFSLNHDFPTEWSAFVRSENGDAFSTIIRKDHFPYFAQGKQTTIKIEELTLYDGKNIANTQAAGDAGAATNGLAASPPQFTFTAEEGAALKREADARVYLIVSYSLSR